MDTRSLIALGMILAVLSVALLTKALDGPAAKDVLMMLGSGIVGSLVPRAAARFRSGDAPTPDMFAKTEPSDSNPGTPRRRDAP